MPSLRDSSATLRMGHPAPAKNPCCRSLGRLFLDVGIWVGEEMLAELFELGGCLLDLLGAGIAERGQESVVFFEQEAGILFDDCNLGASLVGGGGHQAG